MTMVSCADRSTNSFSINNVEGPNWSKAHPITGTVKAFATGKNSKDGTQILLYDGDEYFYISATYETVIIESDEDIPDYGHEAELEEYLEYNMKVKIWLDENEEDDSADKDEIKLYLN
ncbi:hypothetical protein [Desulfoscipio gibsoniae]|uniref:hypothetical protein n=1 Tax=Desulfoscipio gibsoniae TaxID=102134 RepID=UPI000232C5B5|nr:hypothetical protein [Desulfoscipio gibsoniae]